MPVAAGEAAASLSKLQLLAGKETVFGHLGNQIHSRSFCILVSNQMYGICDSEALTSA
jgi:hypothetical protein